MRAVVSHFEAMAREAMTQNPHLDIDVRTSGADAVSAQAFIDGESVAACRLWLERDERSGGMIKYASNLGGYTGSFNGWLSLEENDRELKVKASFISTVGNDPLLEPDGAAELVWNEFFERVRSAR